MIDPDTQVTVCCGSTEAMIATLLAIVDPGDEVIVFEPFYENYGPDAILSGATPRFVRLRPPAAPGRRLVVRSGRAPRRRSRIARAPSSSTRPTTPRARCSRARNSRSSRVSARRGTRSRLPTRSTSTSCTTPAVHVSLASLDGMADRTVTINSVSKTFSVTGWRVGWAIAPPDITGAIRKVHDFLTVGAAAPLQAAAAAALESPRELLRRPGREIPRAAATACSGFSPRRASCATRRTARTTS